MNLAKVGSWLTLFANFGVIAGVVFLAYEIQQNNELLVQQSRFSMLQNQKDWKMFLTADREIAKIIYGPQVDELNEIDRIRRFEILSGVLFTWQWEWTQFQAGLLGASDLPIEAFRAVWEIQNTQLDWPALKPTLDPGFAEFLEKNVTD